jgi:NADH dehydrogenase [ubiquinone] 1 alpha subcomplex assembly factor 5
MNSMEAAPDVFDRRLIATRRERAAAKVGQVAPILEAAADLLLDRLDDTTRRFSRALDLGGRGAVAPALRARGVGFIVSMDLSPGMVRRAGGLALAGDEEWLRRVNEFVAQIKRDGRLQDAAKRHGLREIVVLKQSP